MNPPVEAPPHPAPVAPKAHRIDPRIRARRIEVQRSAGRRRLLLTLGVLAIAAAVTAFWAASRSVLLDVDRVEVVGAVRTGDAARVAAGIELGDQLADLDVESAARAVAALPWVAEARVVSDWRGSVRIEVTERDPAALLVLADGKAALVDGTGRVLAVDRGTPDGAEGLPAVAGGPASVAPGRVVARPVAAAAAVAGAMSPASAAAVEVLELDAAGQLRLVLRDGGSVLFGEPARDAAAKLIALDTVLRQVDLTDVVSIDLRVPTSPVVQRTPPPEPDAAAGG